MCAEHHRTGLIRVKYKTVFVGTQIPLPSAPDVDKQTFYPRDSYPGEKKTKKNIQLCADYY